VRLINCFVPNAWPETTCQGSDPRECKPSITSIKAHPYAKVSAIIPTPIALTRGFYLVQVLLFLTEYHFSEFKKDRLGFWPTLRIETGSWFHNNHV
jgi:hypothetical protein